MMYRCRIARFALPAFLSLAIIMAFFVFPASAEEASTLKIGWQYSESPDSGYSEAAWRNVSDGFAYGLQGHKYWQFTSLRIYHDNLDTDLWITFDIGFIYPSDNTNTYLTSTITSGDGKKVGTATTGSTWYFNFISANGSPPLSFNYMPDYYPLQNGRTCLCHFQYQSRTNGDPYSDFTFSTRTRFAAAGSPKAAIIPVIYNVHVYHDISDLISSGFSTANNYLASTFAAVDYMSAFMSDIATYTGNTSTYTLAIKNQFDTLASYNYSWNEISYNDQTEELETDTETGSWWDAILGTLKSLVAPNEQQQAMQDKANTAGAGDALDDAFDAAGSGSFGALSDFGDISDMGSWSGSNFSSNSTGLFSNWFSNEIKNSIDAVPQSRAPTEPIIDWYHQNIEEIEELLNDGSAN